MHLVRDILLFLIAAAGVTAVASLWSWWGSEPRRLRRRIRRTLGRRPEVELIGFGGAAALDFAGRRGAFTGTAGRARSVELDRLSAMEVICDGQVIGRACRGDARRSLDRAPAEARELVLRFVFDDPRDPDAHVVFWRAGARAPLDAAVQAGRGWLARGDALVREHAAPQVRTSAPMEPDEFEDEDEPETP
jgi:hypothetical protein